MQDYEVPESERNATVAIYRRHDDAERGIKTLEHAGMKMKNLSIVGKGYHSEEQVVGYYNLGDRMKHWGKTGAFWGSLWGFLFGGLFLIPGLGPVLAAGWIVSALVGILGGAALGGGVGLFAGALSGNGIPNDSVVRYESALKADKFLVIMHGTRDEVTRAKEILASTTPEHLDTHFGPSKAEKAA
jgi:hypothetical protein